MSLEQLLAVLRRRWPLIVAVFIVTAAVAFVLSVRQTKEYTATASLVFNNNQLNQQVAGLPAVASSEAQTLQSTNVRLVALGSVASTAKQVGQGLTPQKIRNSLTISAEAGTNIVKVAATSTSPAVAANIANIYSRQFVGAQQKATSGYFSSALALVRKQLDALSPEERVSPAGLALQNRAQSLEILSQIQSGNVQIAQIAQVPTSPSSPKPKRNTILGGLFGLLLGLGIAFFLEWRNRKLRDPEETREAFDLPILGTIPESKAITASNQGPAAVELPFLENEAFRMLRSSLRYFNVDHDVKSLLVTSHTAGAGKSTIAWNLARVAASSSNVIVVETDLRKPTLSRQHGLAPGPGLAEVLTNQVTLEQTIQFKPLANSADGSAEGGPTLGIIVAGSLPPNPAELIESHAMQEVLGQLREWYDLIIIDTAPVGAVSDAFPLMSEVNGVIVVARMDVTTRDSAQHMREQLGRLDAPVLGVVANGIKMNRRGKYGYGYYGAYYGPDEPSGDPVNSNPPSVQPAADAPPPAADSAA